MDISRSTIAVVAAAVVTVGGGAAYVLMQRNTAGVPAAAATNSGPAVESSEALVTEPTVGSDASRPPAAAVATTARMTSSNPTPRPREGAASHARAPRPRSSAPENAAPAAPRESDTTLPVRALEPPAPVSPQPTPAASVTPSLEELVVSADSVIGLQMESSVSSEQARIEDQVTAQVTRDVKVGDRVAIPAGSKAYGEVTSVERGGRMRDRARLSVRFTSIVLGDGTRVPIETDAIVREGSSPTGESAAKIGGGAIGGAILGGIFGGTKGAVIGGSAGAGAGTAAVMAGGRNPATLPSGTPVTVKLQRPATVTVEK